MDLCLWTSLRKVHLLIAFLKIILFFSHPLPRFWSCILTPCKNEHRHTYTCTHKPYAHNVAYISGMTSDTYYPIGLWQSRNPNFEPLLYDNCIFICDFYDWRLLAVFLRVSILSMMSAKDKKVNIRSSFIGNFLFTINFKKPKQNLYRYDYFKHYWYLLCRLTLMPLFSLFVWEWHWLASL